VQIGDDTSGRFALDFGDSKFARLTLSNLHARY
jgi:hypothetical protein